MRYFTIDELCRSDAATAMGIDNRYTAFCSNSPTPSCCGKEEAAGSTSPYDTLFFEYFMMNPEG